MKNFANGIKATNREIILDFPGRLNIITRALKHKRKAEESESCGRREKGEIR